MAESATTSRKISPLAKVGMRLQVFLLRRNWLGPLGNQVMVITTRGRITGQSRSTPIGYLKDGDRLLALNIRGATDWFKNMLANPEVTLEIKGRRVKARGESVKDPQERRRIFALYQRERAGNFRLYFGVPVDAPVEELEQALASRQFVAFYPY